MPVYGTSRRSPQLPGFWIMPDVARPPSLTLLPERGRERLNAQWGRIDPYDIERGYRIRETFQRQFAYGLGFDHVLDPGQRPLIGEDLPAFCLGAQPRREIGHRADRGVLPSPLEADRTERGKSLCDADAE